MGKRHSLEKIGDERIQRGTIVGENTDGEKTGEEVTGHKHNGSASFFFRIF